MALTSASQPSLWRFARVEFDPVRNRPVLLYPEGAVLLNETGAEILKLLDGRRTLRQIAEALKATLPVKSVFTNEPPPLARIPALSFTAWLFEITQLKTLNDPNDLMPAPYELVPSLVSALPPVTVRPSNVGVAPVDTVNTVPQLSV